MQKRRRHIPESSFRAKMKHRYGITVEQRQQMQVEQNNKCAICEAEGKLYVDHDHETKQVRQLLCPGCNTMIGGLENDKSTKGIEYLIKHQAWNALARLELMLKDKGE